MILNEIIEEQLLGIAASERMKECLQLRLKLIGTNKASKSKYELNELEITKLKTEAQIDKMNIIIFDKKEIFKDSLGIYLRELSEQESNQNVG